MTLLLVLLATTAHAQRPSRTAIDSALLGQPYFSIHKDNYFVTGAPTNKSVDRTTADAKYQVSFKQILVRKGLPWDAYLFLTYTQKAFWNVYETSLPFTDVNFNPAFSLGKLVYDRNDRLRSVAALSLEHESNGRDSTFSRTWNRLTLEYITTLGRRTTLGLEAWLPWGYSEGTEDILEYVGLGEINLAHVFKPDKLYYNLTLRKGLNLEARGVIRSRLYYSPFRRNRSNQYLMLEWYLGQAESLLQYQESRSVLRIGYVIRSNEFDLFRGGRPRRLPQHR